MNRKETLEQLRKTKDALQASVARVDAIMASITKEEEEASQLLLFEERFPVTRPIMNKERNYEKN